MHRNTRLCCLLICLVAMPAAFCQTTTAEIIGKISDSTGGVIAGAAIIVLNMETGVKSDSKSNDAGEYSVPLLQPGGYRITVQKGRVQTDQPRGHHTPRRPGSAR